jgi:hypothetical protein
MSTSNLMHLSVVLCVRDVTEKDNFPLLCVVETMTAYFPYYDDSLLSCVLSSRYGSLTSYV